MKASKLRSMLSGIPGNPEIKIGHPEECALRFPINEDGICEVSGWEQHKDAAGNAVFVLRTTNPDNLSLNHEN